MTLVIITDSNPDFQLFGFVGGIYDSDTGLNRFGFRDYDAGSARWTSKDPLDLGGGSENLYSYASNDSINYLDFDGLDSIRAALLRAIGKPRR